MAKITIGKKIVSIAPTVIAGTKVNEKPNFITVGSYGSIAPGQSLLYISLNKAHYSNIGIKESGYFSVNLPSKELVLKTDYVGIVSGKNIDKSNIFSIFYGSDGNVPMIEECPVNMVCKVFQTVDIPSRDVFIGEVVETFINVDCWKDNIPCFERITPLVVGGGFYWELGNKVAEMYKDGKKLIK
jgi:flavin reductase (DIM6/NTAB) family NADH-FMN oxidoreductase RutF